MARCLLVYDDPSLPEMDNRPMDEKVAYLRQVTDQDKEIVRYAVVMSDLSGAKQEHFLLWLIRTITEDYHADRSQELDDRGEQRES